MAGCNRKHFAQRLRVARARAQRKHLPADLRPLFNHMNLARDDIKGGNAGKWASYRCRRAGREITMAENLVKKHGTNR